jgi:hypothetical protein
MKKEYVFLGFVVLLVASIATLSIYKYNQAPKGVTVTDALHQRDTALLDLQAQKAINNNDQEAIKNLTADKQTAAAQKVTLCAQIKAAKLVQPLCQ